MVSARDRLNSRATRLAAGLDRGEIKPIVWKDEHEGVFFYIDLSLISTDPDQPRKYFNPDSLSDLCESIKKTGVLQPVLVRMDSDGRVWLVAGERRYRAAGMAGLERIPAIMTKGNPHEIALIENLQREDLNPIEEAEALDRLASGHQYTHEDLSKAIGKARSTITEILSLNRLPEVIKAECRLSKRYPRRFLVEIAKCKSEEDMVRLFQKSKKGSFSSDHIRAITRKTGESVSKIGIQATINKARILSKDLNKLNPDIIQEDEKMLLHDELRMLEKHIFRVLENVGAPTSRGSCHDGMTTDPKSASLQGS